MTAVDVVGSSPISFTKSDGAQSVVPLSALQLNGSSLELKSAWQAAFTGPDAVTLLEVAKARRAAGELTAPAVPTPAPAILITAARSASETNNIVVTVEVEKDKLPLSTGITFKVAETDTYPGLRTGAAAASGIGVDTSTGNAGDPAAGTGLAVVKHASFSGSAKPVAHDSWGVLEAETGVDLTDEDGKTVMTLLPRKDYHGKGGLSYEVTTTSADTFTIAVTYESWMEAAPQPVTIQSLDKLPAQVAYLVKVSAPGTGAALPGDGSVQLSGGGTDRAATGVLYATAQATVPSRSREAIAVSATRNGLETNSIVVTVGAEKGKPADSTGITFTVTEKDYYRGLQNASDAANVLGVDGPSGPSGTGLVVVRQGSSSTSSKPAIKSGGVLEKQKGVDLIDDGGQIVLTLQARKEYDGKGGLSYEVTPGSDGTFTIEVAYDSALEEGTQPPVTLDKLNKLPAQVAYLIKASAPPTGAAVPADGAIKLAGGDTKTAAIGMLRTGGS